MKKILFFVIAMICAVSLLTSCDNTNESPQSKEQSSDKTEETSTQVATQSESTENNTERTELTETTAATENTESADTSADTEATPEIIIRDVDFNQYLDDINFVPRISQSDFKKLMDTYTYNGKKLSDITEGMWYDGFYGGGYSAWNDEFNFGFVNDYTVTDDEKYSIYKNVLNTSVQLDGLKLPNDIKFGYTLSTVLMSFNLNVDLESAFVDAEDATVIIYGDESSSLKLKNCLLTDGASESKYSYQLTYEENYPITYQNGKEATVTRSFEMSFAKDDATLCGLKIAVVEKCDRNQ